MDAHRVPTLASRLADALGHATDFELQRLSEVEPDNPHDEMLSLALIHDLHLAPVTTLGNRAQWQHHPVVAALKQRAESRLIASITRSAAALPLPPTNDLCSLMRSVATRDRVPPIYTWIAEHADRDAFIEFVMLEGGPDDGFDDLVALCQVGMSGIAKLEMAQNYWDEMGRGNGDHVHRVLHQRLSTALDLPTLPREAMSSAALRRSLLTSTFATNRHYQGELIGLLGIIELQAGPRCRQVVRGLQRLGLDAAAFPFYEVHADTDPRHGKDWLDHVVSPLARDEAMAAGIARGALWRSAVNHDFFVTLEQALMDDPHERAA